MKEFKWEKASITPDEIDAGLARQYGENNNVSVDMDERSVNIPYKSAAVQLTCHRCGNQFSMTPYSVLNMFYTLGYVCNQCGPLSDEQLKSKKKDHMNEKAIEVLKDHGIDVFEEAAKEEAQKAEKESIAESITEDDINDALEESFNSEYMVSDDDYKSSPKSAESLPLETEEVEKESEVDLARTEAEAKLAKAEEEKMKAVEKAKAEVAKEMSIKAQEEEARIRDEIRAEMEAKMKAEIEAEKAKAAAEIEAAKKAKEEAEKYAAEANLRAQEAEKATNTSVEDDSEEEYADQSEEIDEEDTSNWVDVESDVDEDVGEEKSDVFFKDSEEELTEEEFVSRINTAFESVKSNLGFMPWFDDVTVEDDGLSFEATCKICGKNTTFKNIIDISQTTTVGRSFREKHALDPKSNNRDGTAPVISACAHCKASIIKNGFNEYHRSQILGFAQNSHFNVVNSKNHWFIPGSQESFKIECNGVEKELYFTEIMSKFADGQDARKMQEFKPVEKSVESAPVEEKQETPRRVIKPVSKEQQVQETSHVETTSSETNTGRKVLKAKPQTRDDYEVEKKEAKSKEEMTFEEKMREKYNKKSYYEGMTDSNAALDEEKFVEQENILKNTVFKKNHKLIQSKKNVAKLSNKINPFQREEALEEAFNDTAFARFISDLSEESGIECHLVKMNSSTFELPVIDFESGVRIICADLSERSIPNVPFDILGDGHKVPFSYYEDVATDDGTGVLRKKRKPFKWTILFSDSITERHDATFQALMKYINPKKLSYEGKLIELEGNFDIEYTTYDQFLRDFDVRYSPFPGGKPKTGQLGILAHFESSKESTTRDVLNLQLQSSGFGNVANLDSLATDYEQYMVCSIRYIERYNKETNRVVYTITEYVEIGSAMLKDGLTQCIRALVKEYTMKYPQLRTVDPYFIIECDPNCYTSPSIASCIKSEMLKPVNDLYRQYAYGSTFQMGRGIEQHLRYTYVRRPEYRTKESDNFRHDMRMFSTGTLIKTMKDEIMQAGIQNTIRDPNVRNAFISNMGYTKAKQAEVREMFVSQGIISGMLLDSKTMFMRKHIEADNVSFQNTTMVSDSNTGIGIHNVLTNPALISKYNRIMQNGTPEAKQYLMQQMYQSNPILAAQYQQMQNMQQNGQNKNSNQFGMGFNPMMGMGMGMPGMNPMMGMGFGF